MAFDIRPCDDADQLRAYIDTHWRAGHVLARSAEMFAWTYCSPWVDRATFGGGMSVLGLYDGSELMGFLGAQVAPYPRPQSYWGQLWHVRRELKGGGFGGALLSALQEIADAADGWYGGFGIGPEALPVYLKRGYAVRAVRRWVYTPDRETVMELEASEATPAATGRVTPLNTRESLASEQWREYRYAKHPLYRYDVRCDAVFRTEENVWGRVTHAVWRGAESHGTVAEEYASQVSGAPIQDGRRCYVLDAWSYTHPGAHWRLAPDDLPDVFHPVAARGNLTYAVGRPFLPAEIHKGDADQDRPNLMEQFAATQGLCNV